MFCCIRRNIHLFNAILLLQRWQYFLKITNYLDVSVSILFLLYAKLPSRKPIPYSRLWFGIIGLFAYYFLIFLWRRGYVRMDLFDTCSGYYDREYIIRCDKSYRAYIKSFRINGLGSSTRLVSSVVVLYTKYQHAPKYALILFSVYHVSASTSQCFLKFYPHC